MANPPPNGIGNDTPSASSSDGLGPLIRDEHVSSSSSSSASLTPPVPHVVTSATPTAHDITATIESPALRSLKAQKWTSGRALTAHVQDLALRDGKRAMVATSGGSFKKFVCSSETPCSWLVNAVRTRPRARKEARQWQDDDDSGRNKTNDDDGMDEDDDDAVSGGSRDGMTARASRCATKAESPRERTQPKYWYVSSAHLVHSNCTGMAKPTARQLKNVATLKQAVTQDAKISSSALVDQLKNQARLLCSKSMVYKAKIDLLDELEATQTCPIATPVTASANTEAAVSTQRLPSYLARLSALNPDVFHAVERDPISNAHFYRAVVALDPLRFFSRAAPLVFGVDSLQETSSAVSGGAARLVLQGCDGNFETITFAFALVPDATEEHLAWFLSKLVDCGYPLQHASGVFTDGRWASTSACVRVGIQSMIQNTRCVIEDINEAIRRQFAGYEQRLGIQKHTTCVLSSDQVACVWAAQRAESEVEFNAALHRLEMAGVALPSVSISSHLIPDSGILAEQYLRTLDPRRWALFPRFTTSRLFGWQSTTCQLGQHQDQGENHEQLPYELFEKFAITLQKEAAQRHERAAQWEREQRVVTPEAERMMQEEMKFVPMYDVVMSAPHVAFVWNPEEAPQPRQRRVDLQAKSCTCSVSLQLGVPCRHILSVLRKLNALSRSFEFFDDCLRVRGYVDTHRGRHIKHPQKEGIEIDKTWLPVKHVVERSEDGGSVVSDVPVHVGSLEPQPSTSSGLTSSSRKRRIRNKPADERKRPMYKCRKCSIADGHNSLTCPNRRGPTKQ